MTGVVTFAVAQACLAWVLWFRAAPAIRVDDRVFRAGPARLPIPFIGEVRVLDEAATRGLRGPAGEASAYFCVRPAVASRAVAVVVADPADPHPYWLVSSRRPDELATALARAVADRATM